MVGNPSKSLVTRATGLKKQLVSHCALVIVERLTKKIVKFKGFNTKI